MTPRHALLGLLVPLVWGCNFVVIIWGMEDIPPLLFAALRFTLVAIPLIFFIPTPGVPWRQVVLIGTFMMLGQFSLLYIALALGLPSGLTAIVMASQPLMTVAIAAFWVRESPTTIQTLGLGVGLLGLILVGISRGANAGLWSFVVCLMAALSWAIGNVLARKARATSAFSLSIYASAIAPIPLLILSLVFDGPEAIAQAMASFGWQAWLSTAYTVVLATWVGYGIWNMLLAQYPAAKVTPLVLLVPPFGVAAGWLAYGEVPTAGETVGAAMLLCGATLSLLRIPRRRRAIPTQPAPSAEPVKIS